MEDIIDSCSMPLLKLGESDQPSDSYLVTSA